ncbi:unnamed protein product [Didymodactylos carnosus]|uniref:Uncharacterized protein n=1 Tax=Didymodactylos carnosus TaxID=1234261 RepID=A0A816E7M7_9BILA|nr:unnamed protein product [Didymodactylos carnosus]CAF1643173.1 unnamed protein product [Didymodactylos carnosus]CAF4303140.1 unnamed protein product [Didymodactylos carnosus]CAF4557949.1 unnamed protein product [Didymodactylos carnosus]
MTDLLIMSVKNVVQAMYQFMIDNYEKSKKDVIEFENNKHEVFESIYINFSLDRYESVDDADLESMVNIIKTQFNDSLELKKLTPLEFRIANRSKDIIEFLTRDNMGNRIIGKLVHVRTNNNNKIEHNFAVMTQRVIYTLKPNIQEIPQSVWQKITFQSKQYEKSFPKLDFQWIEKLSSVLNVNFVENAQKYGLLSS